jgi:hypothetical protein
MKQLYSLGLLILVLAGSFLSCKQAPVEYVHRVDTLYIRDTVHLSDTNALKLKGTLHGKAYIYDYLRTVTDSSGITVSMEGTPFTAVTDAAGNWTMRDLPTATYTIVYSKEGFGTYRYFGFQFVGGSEIYLPSTIRPILPRIPTEQMSDLRVSDVKDYGNGDIYYFLDGKLSPPRAGISAQIFIGRDTTVSSDPSTYLYSFSVLLDSTTGSFIQNSASLGSPTLYSAGFKKGEPMYMVAYPNAGGNAYWDPRSERYVLIGLGPNRSNVRGTRVP